MHGWNTKVTISVAYYVSIFIKNRYAMRTCLIIFFTIPTMQLLDWSIAIDNNSTIITLYDYDC